MPTDLVPDVFSRVATLLGEGAEPALAWEVVRDYCSPACLLGFGDEERRCTCRCKKEFGLGMLLHGYLRNHRIDCVPRRPRLEPAPDDELAALLDGEARLRAEALPEARPA